jgi:hypothetical protein
VQLGATLANGLPASLFTSGEARWVGVQISGQEEQPRTLLTSVAYAMKAVDAQTVGGLPASAFVLAVPPTSGSSSSSSSGGSGGANPQTLGGSGTADYVPLWTNSTTLGNSVLYQSGTGSSAKVGINTTSPASTLDVKGGSTVRGLFTLPATGTATSSKGYNSQPHVSIASVFNSSTATAVNQKFQWQAEPVGNNTSTASGTLNLLFAQGTNKLAETGLNIASTGLITFASGQKFPGTGTITGVTAGTGLTGGGTSGNVSLAIAASYQLPQTCSSNQVPQWNGSGFACWTPNPGTITGVTAGAGLTGGGSSGNVTLSVPSSGITNAMLKNSSLTVTAGTDLTGGGAVSLGGSTTLALDTTKVPTLAGSNTFTGTQTINNNVTVTATGTTLSASGGSTGLSGTGSGYGVVGSSNSGYGVYGSSESSSAAGVIGYNGSGSGSGVIGGGSSGTSGVFGYSSSGDGVYGSSSSGTGVYGNSSSGTGVYGYSGLADGMLGYSFGTAVGTSGVYGQAGGSSSNQLYGVFGNNSGSNNGAGVYGQDATSGSRSNTGSSWAYGGAGVWGDGGTSANLGLLVTTDDYFAAEIENNSADATLVIRTSTCERTLLYRKAKTSRKTGRIAFSRTMNRSGQNVRSFSTANRASRLTCPPSLVQG